MERWKQRGDVSIEFLLWLLAGFVAMVIIVGLLVSGYSSIEGSVQGFLSWVP